MKKFKIIIAMLVVLILAGSSAKSQEDSVNQKPAEITNLSNYLKISPFNLFEVESSIQLGYSYPIKNGKEQMQFEAGYVFLNAGYFPDNELERTLNGFRIRTNYRRYVSFYKHGYKSFNDNSHRYYLGLDGMYKYSKYIDYNKNVWRLGGQYLEITDIATEKNIGALHFIVGEEMRFIHGSESILDFYFGMGLRYKFINTYNMHTFNDTDLNSYRLWYDDFDYPLMVSFMAGMKIGFSLPKR